MRSIEQFRTMNSVISRILSPERGQMPEVSLSIEEEGKTNNSMRSIRIRSESTSKKRTEANQAGLFFKAFRRNKDGREKRTLEADMQQLKSLEPIELVKMVRRFEREVKELRGTMVSLQKTIEIR